MEKGYLEICKKCKYFVLLKCDGHKMEDKKNLYTLKCFRPKNKELLKDEKNFI